MQVRVVNVGESIKRNWTQRGSPKIMRIRQNIVSMRYEQHYHGMICVNHKICEAWKWDN